MQKPFSASAGALSLVATALLSSTAAAQQTFFFRSANPVTDGVAHADPAAALAHLCRGPSPAERRTGSYSNVPPGTRLLGTQTLGDTLVVTFSEELLAPTPEQNLEDAIEQIDKTALSTPGVRAVRIRVRAADGSERELGDALGRGAAPQQAIGAPQVAPAVSPFGALAGKRVAVSPGHGYYWHSSLGWTTQRGDIDGLIEDISNAEICNRYLIPLLENLGVEVVHTREHGEVPQEALVDNDQGAPAYSETGGWTTSASSGYQNSTYRFAGSTSGPESATATWTLPVPQDGLYPVYAWFRASGNRTPSAHYRVTHSGGTSEVVVDQTRDDRTWAHLGTFWFSAQQGCEVVLSNESQDPGVVIADAVRLGGGVGSIARGGGTSQQARWRECARYWAQFSGAPSSVYDSLSSGQDNGDDVTARPRFAEWRGADAFVSVHTNAGGGSGTDTFIYSGGATAGSSQLSQTVHTQLIADLRSEWNAGWVDRGQKQANFGELRLLSSMPGILVELAFHDQPGSLDHRSIHDPEFRRIASRAIARGVLRYFAPSAPFPPEPPSAFRIVQDGARGLSVRWDAVAGATYYTVERADDGKGFAEVANVTTTSWSTGPLPHHSWRTFRVRAWNQTGRSLPTEVLSAGTDHTRAAQVLLVQGFDRLGRYVKAPDNTRDYQHLVAAALRDDPSFSAGFDAATNDAVKLGRTLLTDYDAVVWSLGEESTADDTFDTQEQFLVSSYLNQGGGLLAHGAEIGWDLDAQGSAGDRSFYRNSLGTTYQADDAGVYSLQAGVPGTVGDGSPFTTFDDGSGPTYDVDWPDVIAPTIGGGWNGTVCLRYSNGLVAGIQTENAATGARVVMFGLPLETVTSQLARARLLQQGLGFALGDRLPLRGPRTLQIGQSTNYALRLEGEAGLPYICGLSNALGAGIPLPLGGLFPLTGGPLLDASITPGSPLFVDFVGALDANAEASPQLTVPNLPFLVGLELYAAAFTVSPVVPAERLLSNWTRLTLVQ